MGRAFLIDLRDVHLVWNRSPDVIGIVLPRGQSDGLALHLLVKNLAEEVQLKLMAPADSWAGSPDRKAPRVAERRKNGVW